MYTGKVIRPVVIRDNVAFTSIELDDGNPIQMVLFRKHRPAEVCNKFFDLKTNEEVTVNGSMESNPQTGEKQIVITGFGDMDITNPISKDDPIWNIDKRIIDEDDSYLDF